jgi:hypothetical protein
MARRLCAWACRATHEGVSGRCASSRLPVFFLTGWFVMTNEQMITDKTVELLLATDPAKRAQTFECLVAHYVDCLCKENPRMSDREVAQNAAGYAFAVRPRMQEIAASGGVTQVGHA